ncbi:hypothetical protein V8C86DRAFT_466937 [Haematococcus lacustris]
MRAMRPSSRCPDVKTHKTAGSRTARTAARVAAAAPTAEAQAYQQLLSYANIQTCLSLVSTPHGNGLATDMSVKKGQVLLSVPKSLALMLDYNEGLQIPAQGSWPRLVEGVQREGEPLTWDLLLALGLMDGLAGDGGPFWGAWCQAVLPPPEDLTIPLTWPDHLLQQLQHREIQAAARQQQERLTSLFPPALTAESAGPGSCSWLAWAWACVRSRSIKVTDDCFALVPFLDLANHASTPSAGYRLAGSCFELYALKDLQQGQEVSITYSGEAGYTNQRFMAQYGFVPEGGNPADRLTFDLTTRPSTSSPPAGSVEGVGAGGGEELGGSGTGLSLEHIQSCLGDTVFMETLTCRRPYLHAALRSLPIACEDLGTFPDTTSALTLTQLTVNPQQQQEQQRGKLQQQQQLKQQQEEQQQEQQPQQQQQGSSPQAEVLHSQTQLSETDQQPPASSSQQSGAAAQPHLITSTASSNSPQTDRTQAAATASPPTPSRSAAKADLLADRGCEPPGGMQQPVPGLQLAASLHHQCVQMLQAFPTSCAEDERLLACAAPSDMRIRAALRYRMERKSLLLSCQALLSLYLRCPPTPACTTTTNNNNGLSSARV